MTISDVMTPNPEFCLVDDTLLDCAQLMAHKDVGLIPICESRDTRRVVGVVTDRDIVVRAVAEDRDPAVVRAGEVMSQRLVTCTEIDDLAQVTQLMEDHQVRRILVIYEYGSLVGVVATADLARNGDRADVAEALEAISAPAPSPTK